MTLGEHTLVAVVNGAEIKVKAHNNESIGNIISQALSAAGVVGKAEDWGAKSANSAIYDNNALLGSLNLPSEAVLYLNLRGGGEAG